MPPSYFPLRWESTGDQWWYASPIDFAAANGQYDVVRELLYIDTNLLIKLTSLRRIRRLESVWDDEEQFDDVARCRSLVARNLLLECETKRGHNTLIRAGYGGWLLYTAASAGDICFVKELLDRDPLLVFGEGEYGVTDILYAAARSKNSDVFRLLLDFSISSRCGPGYGGDMEGQQQSEFKWEMKNRAVHAAARGGNLEILKGLLGGCSDVLAYRDAQGSTLLHAAAGRGQVEVVKDLIASFDIISSADYQGNTALHVAAYRGYLNVVEVLVLACPSLTSLTNNYGDTFLHMAVSGFRAPGFRRVDRQIELMKHLVSGKIVDTKDVVNVRNNDGRTALHLAVVENVQTNPVELLMSLRGINLNIRDDYGMTPLDLLKQRPRSASSEILIRQLISAGGVSNCQDNVARSAIVSHLRGQGIGCSPGTSFRVPDSEIFLYTGIENASDMSCDLRSENNSKCLSESSDLDTGNSSDKRKASSVNYAARRLKALLQWPRKKEKKTTNSDWGDDDSLDSFSCRSFKDHQVPLRQKYSKQLSFSSNNMTFSGTSLPSPLTRKKFTAGLMHGVIQPFPHITSPIQSASSPLSGSTMSSPLDRESDINVAASPVSNRSFRQKQASFNNKKLMNQYFCFGAHGVAVQESISHRRPGESYKRPTSLVA